MHYASNSHNYKHNVLNDNQYHKSVHNLPCEYALYVHQLLQALLLYHYAVFHTVWLEKMSFPQGQSALSWMIAICPLLICVTAGFLHALRKANIGGWQVNN